MLQDLPDPGCLGMVLGGLEAEVVGDDGGGVGSGLVERGKGVEVGNAARCVLELRHLPPS